MDFRILGPLEVTLDAGPVRIRRRERELLSVLLLYSGWPCSKEMLARALWGDTLPDDPQATLRVCVSRARSALGKRPAACLVTLDGAYRADPPPGSLDLHRFRDLLSQAAAAEGRGDLRQAADLLGRALRCWRLPPLADLPSSPEIEAEKACLLEQRRLTELDHADLLLDLGLHEQIVADLHARVIADQRCERGWAQLILALHRCGRRGEALAHYAKARAALSAEYGARPGSDLQAILSAVLDDDGPAVSRRFRGLTSGVTTASRLPVIVRQYEPASSAVLSRRSGPGPG